MLTLYKENIKSPVEILILISTLRFLMSIPAAVQSVNDIC